MKKIIFPSILCLVFSLTTNFPIVATAVDVFSADKVTEIHSQSTNDDSAQPSNSNTTYIDTINIPDDNLRQLILSTLKKTMDSPLTKSDMESLTALYLSTDVGSQISSLEGLQYAVNLDSFSMTASMVTDFSPLEQLSNLIIVDLGGENLTSENFPDLVKSPGITRISAANAQLDDSVMPKIAQLKELQRLYLDRNNNITSIESLKALPKLRSMSVQLCGINDFTVINEFPALNDLAAYGQNIGNNAEPTTLQRSALTYNLSQQTLFIPFTIMPNRMINFDGYVPPFTTSNAANNTILSFNGTQLSPDRLQITDQGITVTGADEHEFTNLSSIKYNARIDNPSGNYAEPDNYGFYSISNGLYLHQFNVIDEPKDAAAVTVRYLDELGNDIADPLVLNGKVNEAYKTSPQEIEDWILKIVPEETEGNFTENEQEIHYIYEKAAGASVTVDYLDEQGNKLSPSEILNGQLDAPYETKEKQLEGWKLKELPANHTGLFTHTPQTIIYSYIKLEESSLSLTGSNQQQPFSLLRLLDTYKSRGHFLNELFTQNMTEQHTHHYLHQNELAYPITSSVQSLWPKDSTIEPIKQNMKKKKSTRKTGSVTIKFVDEHGNEIAAPDTLVGRVGEAYKVSAKSLKEY